MSHAQLIQRLYDSFATGSAETLAALLHDDVEWIQMPGFPGGGRHAGRHTVLETVFGNIQRDWENWTARPNEILELGQSAVLVLGEYSALSRQTGKQMSAPFAHIYEIQDGRITRYRQYADTLLIEKARTPGRP